MEVECSISNADLIEYGPNIHTTRRCSECYEGRPRSREIRVAHDRGIDCPSMWWCLSHLSSLLGKHVKKSFTPFVTFNELALGKNGAGLPS